MGSNWALVLTLCLFLYQAEFIDSVRRVHVILSNWLRMFNLERAIVIKKTYIFVKLKDEKNEINGIIQSLISNNMV